MSKSSYNSQAPQLLEKWLQEKSNSSLANSTTPTKLILQSWSTLRSTIQSKKTLDSSDQKLVHQALLTLSDSQPSLHLSDTHASLLLSLLNNFYPDSLPLHSLPPLLNLLSLWARSSPFPSPSILNFILRSLSSILDSIHWANADSQLGDLPSQSILLLGALSAAPNSPLDSPELLSSLLDNHHFVKLCRDSVPDLLAGIGYALVRCSDACFRRIFRSLMGIWRHGPCPCVGHGVMVFKLMEWLVFGFAHSQSWERVGLLCTEISRFRETNFVGFSVVMAASGVLRAFNRLGLSSTVNIQGFDVRKIVEDSIDSVATDLISKTEEFQNMSSDDSENRLVLQCMSLGLARSSLVFFSSSVLLCLVWALLNEIFPLKSFFGRIIDCLDGNFVQIGVDDIKEHVGSVLFKEVGAVTSAFCNQYGLADEEKKLVVENYVWSFCLDIYSKHRRVALLLRHSGKHLLMELEKIAEAAFLMVVVFASAVAKHKVSSKFSNEIKGEAAVNILVSFSCVEYLRSVRLPEYSDTVRRVVLCVQESDLAGSSFVNSLPCYLDLINQPGLRGSQYIWYEDEVQTARILFYLRVIPTCIERIPHDLFKKKVASTMFLYMQHPSGKVARASHSVFVAFISSGKDDQEDRALLKEQLVFYGIQRALEAYPGITPFEGLASGVAAVVRNLPAGSPAIFYCIQKLIEKATSLCTEEEAHGIWKSWQGNSGPSKKILELLFRLITLVDIQVLPYLLKLLANLIASRLPKEGQNVVLDEIYSLIAESDDVTRKPILVSWVQSLSFLCSQTMSISGKHHSHSSKSTTTQGSNLSLVHNFDNTTTTSRL